MKDIEIFVKGGYDYQSDNGRWTYYLSYKKAVIKRSGFVIHCGNSYRATLTALYLGLKQVTEPCNIIVHSKVPLGFKEPKKSKNKELIIQILTEIWNSHHIVNFDTTDDFGRVQIWEQLYGHDSNGGKIRELQQEHYEKTAKPDIENKKTVEEVFSTDDYDEKVKQQALSTPYWRTMYEELMDDDDDDGKWRPGSGGY